MVTFQFSGEKSFLLFKSCICFGTECRGEAGLLMVTFTDNCPSCLLSGAKKYYTSVSKHLENNFKFQEQVKPLNDMLSYGARYLPISDHETKGDQCFFSHGNRINKQYKLFAKTKEAKKLFLVTRKLVSKNHHFRTVLILLVSPIIIIDLILKWRNAWESLYRVPENEANAASLRTKTKPSMWKGR